MYVITNMDTQLQKASLVKKNEESLPPPLKLCLAVGGPTTALPPPPFLIPVNKRHTLT